MPRKASLFRLDSAAHSALSQMGKLLGRPMNKGEFAKGKPDSETMGAVREFVRRVASLYSVKVAILFGSRARGTHRADSDLDVALVLRGPRGNLINTSLEMADIAFDVLLETEVYVQPLPIWEDEWEHPETHSNPRLLENIQHDGLAL
jgi:predicted nucleotidyltransferase